MNPSMRPQGALEGNRDGWTHGQTAAATATLTMVIIFGFSGEEGAAPRLFLHRRRLRASVFHWPSKSVENFNKHAILSKENEK